MKKTFLIAPLLFLLVLIGCKKVDEILTFTVDVSQSVTIPGFVQGAQLAPVTVTTKSEDSFRNNKTTRDKVKDVYLDKMILTVTDPPGNTFDFLKKVDIYISTNSTNKILLAHIDDVPRGVTSITLVPTTSRLDEYLKSDTYDLTAIATSSGFSLTNFTVRSDATFKVTAAPL
ncbi:hypothetical protein [Hymenobacter rubidus]|uniref:hypothetical protein n=1 Tax=Hymenobacter rubidus TaxID=1441626 RepID=UPI00191F2CBB|nr:hypothetical protein [Hymenobacter rubidus]